jgi:hypothetical protein
VEVGVRVQSICYVIGPDANDNNEQGDTMDKTGYYSNAPWAECGREKRFFAEVSSLI